MLGKQQALARIKIINDTNNLIFAVSVLVAEKLVLKNKWVRKEIKDLLVAYRIQDYRPWKRSDHVEREFKNRIQAYAGSLKRRSELAETIYSIYSVGSN